ncbi:uncharacterized protein Ecym_2635 [Eremothecium cymbalariae DBVPG|uniref:Uncharacterized protein n=1 Tax=Eremothecium cymbalariae (strain CBS 270.75 / DBVPG 7215 / KCTC 17166 / NRRL Y-17582) TaxID=931890 RepID=G8JNS2_ERECY|nr:Hypothetical protein Ecym_2635 [Eremothecium cymbalariae DBVPG\
MIPQLFSGSNASGLNQRVRCQQQQQQQQQQSQQKMSPPATVVNTHQEASREARLKLNCMKSFMDDHIFFIDPYHYSATATQLPGQIHISNANSMLSPESHVHAVLGSSNRVVGNQQQPQNFQQHSSSNHLPATTAYNRQQYLQSQTANHSSYAQRQYSQGTSYLSAHNGINNQYQTNRSW